ncbi:hypothetical protein KKE60_07295, partial [Patescibacteria group bacterium]|nr:hypothetical protein [Patescibacteria group bacterium]
KVDGLDLALMRFATNMDRKDFTTIEKGKYIHGILVEEMKNKGHTPFSRYWNQRSIKNEYLSWLAGLLNISKSSVARYLSAWLDIPDEFKHRVANTPEDLKEGKISPTKALIVQRIGRKVKAPKKIWNTLVPETPSDRPVTHKELELTLDGIRKGQITTPEQVTKYREEDIPEMTETMFYLKRSEEKLAAQLASSFDVNVTKVYRASLIVANNHPEELKTAIAEL